MNTKPYEKEMEEQLKDSTKYSKQTLQITYENNLTDKLKRIGNYKITRILKPKFNNVGNIWINKNTQSTHTSLT